MRECKRWPNDISIIHSNLPTKENFTGYKNTSGRPDGQLRLHDSPFEMLSAKRGSQTDTKTFACNRAQLSTFSLSYALNALGNLCEPRSLLRSIPRSTFSRGSCKDTLQVKRSQGNHEERERERTSNGANGPPGIPGKGPLRGGGVREGGDGITGGMGSEHARTHARTTLGARDGDSDRRDAITGRQSHLL